MVPVLYTQDSFQTVSSTLLVIIDAKYVTPTTLYKEIYVWMSCKISTLFACKGKGWLYLGVEHAEIRIAIVAISITTAYNVTMIIFYSMEDVFSRVIVFEATGITPNVFSVRKDSLTKIIFV